MKLIFIDFDGTLYDNRARIIYPSSLSAMEEARNRGHKVFLCSGRSYSGLKEYLPLPVDGICCGSGGEVYIGEELIDSHYMDAESIKKLIPCLDKNRMGYSIETSDGNFLSPAAWDRFLKRHKGIPAETLASIIRSNSWAKLDNGNTGYGKVCKMCVYFSCLSDFLSLMTLSDFHYVVIGKENEADGVAEITRKNVSKATAVQEVAAYYGLNLKNTVAVGDSENDMDLRRVCRLFAAMGNAAATIKESADYITAGIHENGLYHALKHFKLIDGTGDRKMMVKVPNRRSNRIN